MSGGTNKNRLVLVIVPLAAVAIGLSVAFAFAPAAPSPSQQPTEEDDCTSVAGKIKYFVINIDGEGMNETRRVAAATLMDEYCSRPELVKEMSAMAFPSVGLISYGCDAASGKIGEDSLQDSLEEHASIYCEGATLAVLERAEWIGLAVHDFKEEMSAYLEKQKEIFDQEAEQSDSGPSVDFPWVETAEIEKVEAKLKEITGVIDNAKDLVFDGQYYEAAKSLESAHSSLMQLDSEFYS